jgi:flagellar biosynthesis/type III secretory pathway chaperone
MEEEKLIELEQKELNTLKEFLGALTAERDAIISFSLEGIIRENNRKEEILKRLEYIEVEKEKLNSSEAGGALSAENDARRALGAKIEGKVKEVRIALEKNMKLLSFSMDHVKSSLEKIIDFVNRTSYEKGRSISLMVSKRV